MGKFDHIMHTLFLLAIIAFSANYYLQASSLPLAAEKEVVKAVFWLLLLFVLVEVYRLIFKIIAERGKRKKDGVQYSRLRWTQLRTNKSIIVLVSTLAYLLVILPLGTFTASFLYMVVLSYALGSKSIIGPVIINGVVLAICYLLFVTLLDIHFPKGIFI